MLLLAAVIILLPVVATLQYRWLGRVADAEQARMQAVLRSAVAQFSDTFDREITRAYSVFQQHRGSDVGHAAEEIGLATDEWQATALDPAIMRDLYVVVGAADGPTQLMRWNKDVRQLQLIEWPDALAALRDRRALASDYVREEVPALVIPTEREAAIIATIVVLNREYISKVFLPALAARYFGDSAHDGLAYDVAVVSRRDPERVIYTTTTADLASAGEKADAVSSLFEVRLKTLPVSATVAGADPPRRERSATVFRLIKRRTANEPEAEESGRWQLLVRHRAGSLEAAIAAGRWRNLVISFGVLLLLGVSVGFLVISSRRAMRLADDQLKFVAGVTHELRTPLAVICSAGENLADGVVDQRAKAREYGTVIRDEGRRLSRMVEQVLEYAGAEYGRSAYNLQPTDIRSVIDAAANDCRIAFEEGSFEIEREIEDRLPPVNADPSALQRALQNLLSNAVKYDSGRRWIKISAHRQRSEAGQDEVRVTVEDRGSGISTSDLPHVFEPFFRSSDVVAAQVKGSGLGLSLVQHIARAHGGRVTVDSAVGRGSAFTIHLPAAESA